MQYNDGVTEATYTYGADNLRASKTVNGTKTEFVWNGQNLASETTDDVTTIYNYDMTGVLGSKKDGETEIRYHKDPHGNVLATEKNNALTGEYTYDAFGNQLTTAELDNPFRYGGEYFDKESGNIYLRNRYYDTRTGRFINEDPIKDGLNWYSYCGGNPVMLVDPSGMIARFRTSHDKEKGMALIQSATGYDGYYIDEIDNMYVIKDGNVTTTGEGSSITRALLNAIIESDEIVDIVFEPIKLNHSYADNNDGDKHHTICIGNYDNKESEQTGLTHELAHAYSGVNNLSENIQMELTGSYKNLVDDAAERIIRKYQEAIAITVENDSRQELGYQLRSDVGFNENNQEGYGVFPHDLTNNIFTDPIKRNIRPGDVIKANIPYQYGEGIVNYILQNYKH